MDEKPDLSIDRDSLDLEVVAQPEKFYGVASEHVLAASIRDAAYEELKQVDASLNVSIRNAFVQSGEKFTEALVSSMIQTSPEHKAAYETYAEAKLKADELGVYKEALIQRSYMLRELVQLYVTGYSAETSMGTDTTEKRQVVASIRKERIIKSGPERNRRRLSAGE